MTEKQSIPESCPLSSSLAISREIVDEAFGVDSAQVRQRAMVELTAEIHARLFELHGCNGPQLDSGQYVCPLQSMVGYSRAFVAQHWGDVAVDIQRTLNSTEEQLIDDSPNGFGNYL